MSLLTYKPLVDYGDLVIIYKSFEALDAFVIAKGGVFRNKFGDFPHASMVGKPFGSKIISSNKRGWVYVLHPTPELWTRSLPHRTQIIYSSDAAMVAMHLNLKPGAVVVESGTGSGSLSHALIRSIAPTGHLYTFEYHEQRANQARLEFTQHGLGELVTVACRDVCKNGFDLERVADAVFLDLPSPWEAVDSAARALKGHGARLCSFSPCIEQVQKTCSRLRELGFRDLTTFVALNRPFNIQSSRLQEFVPQPLFNPQKRTASEMASDEPEDDASSKGKQKAARQDGDDGRDGSEEKSESKSGEELNSEDTGAVPAADDAEGVPEPAGSETGEPSKPMETTAAARKGFERAPRPPAQYHEFVTARPFDEMQGHTGYLTFAIFDAASAESSAKIGSSNGGGSGSSLE